MELRFEENSNTEEIIDVGRYVLLLKKNAFKITLFSFLVTAITILVVFSMTQKYRATATLLIEAKTRNAISIDEVVGIDSTQKEYYLTQFEILKSNQIAERVIDKLNLSENEEFNASLRGNKSLIDSIKTSPLFQSYITTPKLDPHNAEKIRQNVLNVFKSSVSISPISKTQLVKISFTSQDQELAAEIANEIGKAYIELNLESRLSATKEAADWISNRLHELKSQLDQSEMALTRFLTEERLIDDQGIDSLASSEIASLSNRLAEVTDRRIEIESAYLALKKRTNGDINTFATIPLISEHPQIVAIRTVQLQAETDLTDLSQRYGPKHDKMIQAAAQVKLVSKQVEQIVSQLIKGVGKELSTARAQERLIRKELAQKKDEFRSLTIKKREYESLKREVNTNRNVLNLFLNRQKETTATGDFEATNARFTDKALIPQKPSSPKRKLIAIIALVTSFIFGAVVVFLIDALRNTIESIKHFEELFGLVPLGGIPKVKSKKFKNKHLDSSVFFDNKEMTFNESICSIRTSLLLTYSQKQQKRLAVTSSLPGEGKTTTAINLAISFSKMENVLLVDCDLRKSAIAERFGKKKYQQGVTNHLLMGTELNECIFKDHDSGLSILAAGMLTSNPQELLGSVRFSELLNSLDNKYDRIIIDTPPTLPVSDSLIISQLSDFVLIVAKANSTRVKTIKNTLAKLSGHEIVVNGIIINQINGKVAKANYGYGEYGVYGNYSDTKI
ncbi:polysaccharide biosynthesis tyrosine autokinase [Vibrio makurazakiensis]|uniref:GumC family protein n=1 Tax=Vibrio makurazakiensis TaxID=2910250 RepID=UPI003D146099